MTEWISVDEKLPPEDFLEYVCLTDEAELAIDIVCRSEDGERKFAGECQDDYKIAFWLDMPPIPLNKITFFGKCCVIEDQVFEVKND